MSTTPIADYALVSDCHSAALISRDGSVDWLCFPRFDSRSVFARLLDESAGSWSIRPAGAAEISRRYVERSMVLETTFRTATGSVTLVDALAIGRNERGHELGAESPGVLLRQVTGTGGEVTLELEYTPRPEYGLIVPLLAPIAGGVAARGGADVLVLSSPVALVVEGSVARAQFRVRAGEQIGVALQHCMSWESAPEPWAQEAMRSPLDDTLMGWRTWSGLHQAYEGPWRELVHHSGCVLQALTFQPTGAIVAAPTTSLPESIGGGRNWDYRYTWIRDASFTLDALWVAACPDEAYQFFAWMTGAVASQIRRGVDLQIMYGVGGERDLTEHTLDHLDGWRASQPVPVRNGACNLRQLDVYGETVNGSRPLPAHLCGPDAPTRGFLVEVADAAAAHWQEPDQGIWEVRGGPRHFLYSKLVCWAALASAIVLAGPRGAPDHLEHWKATREAIRQAIEEQGWSERAGAFTQAFGADDLDASALMMPIVGFVPAGDARMKATIDAIAERLTDDRGLVYRYLAHDRLEGSEGTFLLCTFWLAQAQALAGEVEQAKATFGRAIAYTNDVGLLAEEVDPATGELLGNFPQAFSHIGLVNAAWAIAQAEQTSPP